MATPRTSQAAAASPIMTRAASNEAYEVATAHHTAVEESDAVLTSW